jgi:hypothetical protein
MAIYKPVRLLQLAAVPANCPLALPTSLKSKEFSAAQQDCETFVLTYHSEYLLTVQSLYPG